MKRTKEDIEQDIDELKLDLDEATHLDRHFSIQRIENNIRKLEIELEELEDEEED